jgi:hypothetical protein
LAGEVFEHVVGAARIQRKQVEDQTMGAGFAIALDDAAWVNAWLGGRKTETSIWFMSRPA